MWKWVNFFYKYPPRDQCEFRRRALLAFSIQLPLVAVVGLVFLAFIFVARPMVRFIWALVGTLFGIIGINWKQVFLGDEDDPIWYGDVDAWVGDCRNIFIRDKRGDKKHWAWRLFIPMIWIAVWLVFSLGIIWKDYNWDWVQWQQAASVSLMITGTLFVVTVVTLGLIYLLFHKDRALRIASQVICAIGFSAILLLAWPLLLAVLGDLLFIILKIAAFLAAVAIAAWIINRTYFTRERIQLRSVVREQKAEKRRLLLEQLEEDKLRSLTCPPTPIEINYDLLPKKLQTRHLHFQKIKSAVCRPFAN